MPWSPTVPTVSPRAANSSARRGSAPSAERHDPGYDVQSESWSSTVPPSTYRRVTSATTRVGRGLASPVATPRGPQHRRHAEPPRGAQRRVRRDAERRSEPAWSRRRSRSATLSNARVGCRRRRGAACAAACCRARRRARRSRAPRRRPHRASAGVAARHLTEHEERRVPPERVERVEELRRRLGVGTVVERERDVTLAAHAHERGREPHADRRHAAERGRGVHHRDRGCSHESGRADETNRRATASAQLPERRSTQAGRLELARRGRPPRPPWPSGRGRDRRARRPCPACRSSGRLSGRTVKLATTSFCFWRCD